jgi:thiol:disulfide interchange protein
MIYALVVLAVVLFVLWLLLHAAGGLINLLWIVMIVLIGLWLFGFERKTRFPPQRSA